MAKDIYSEILSSVKRNHYELLGLKFFENDQEKIQVASLSQMKKLKAWDLHEDEEVAQQVKDMHIQLSRAIGELQNPGKKQEYDKVLAFELGIEVPYLNNAKELELLNKLDTIQILTKPCPECGGIVLDKEILCIQCGYNFVSKEKLKTDIEKNDREEFTLLSDDDLEKKRTLSGMVEIGLMTIGIAVVISFIYFLHKGFSNSDDPIFLTNFVWGSFIFIVIGVFIWFLKK